MTSARTGGVEELKYIATRHDARERRVDWMVAVTIAGGILAGSGVAQGVEDLVRPGGIKSMNLAKDISETCQHDTSMEEI